MMRERDVEAKIVKQAKKLGCLCWKLVCPGFIGVPDRMVIAPNGVIGFIEVKAPGKTPTKRQFFVINLLKKYNVPVIWTDDPAIAEKFIKHDLLSI